MKVAIVHDYLKSFGGAERVVEALHDIFPKAPIYTSYFDPEGLGEHAKRVKNWDIRTSWFQKVPFHKKLIMPFHLLSPLMFESFDLSEYDLVISSSQSYFAKAIITSPSALHIAYIHTPPRYLYGYVNSSGFQNHWWSKILGGAANHLLRMWDFEVSQRPDILVANSKNVAKRIKKFYRREAEVIYPPVDIDRFKMEGLRIKNQEDYYLTVGRLDKVKNTEVIIEACNQLSLSLKVVGDGPEYNKLKALAGNTIEFLGQVKDDQLSKLYSPAQATIVSAKDEDFGIVPVESMACGTPVLAYAGGGYFETVIEGKTGEFFGGNSGQVMVDNLVAVLKKFDPKKYQAGNLRKQAENFSKERFQKQILELIKANIKG